MSAADTGGLPPGAAVPAAAMPETGEGCLTCPGALPAAAPAEKPARAPLNQDFQHQCLAPATQNGNKNALWCIVNGYIVKRMHNLLAV